MRALLLALAIVMVGAAMIALARSKPRQHRHEPCSPEFEREIRALMGDLPATPQRREQ